MTRSTNYKVLSTGKATLFVDCRGPSASLGDRAMRK